LLETVLVVNLGNFHLVKLLFDNKAKKIKLKFCFLYYGEVGKLKKLQFQQNLSYQTSTSIPKTLLE
jgi:hypothetical protein